MNNKLTEIAESILSKDHFVITGHMNPDGDAIGSVIALMLGLRSIGKKVDAILQDPVPESYFYLHGAESINHVKDEKAIWGNIIYLDCSDHERVGLQVLSRLKEVPYSISIDHHVSNVGFADLNYVDPRAAATAQLVFELLQLMNVEINSQIANALYAGLVQDTGSFKHSNTSSKTFRIAADLLEHGADIEITKSHLFESKSKQEILFLAKALASLTFSENAQMAWMTLTEQDIQALDAKNFFPEGIINYTLLTKGVEVGMLFRELAASSVKVGFRSKGNVNVAAIAELFGGGGHPQASGVLINQPLKEVKNLVFTAIKDVI